MSDPIFCPVLETADSTLVHLSYRVKADWSGGPGPGPTFATAEIETADDRYRWPIKYQMR
jgi:hypothetical protein